jgi:hypothetical protein
MSALVPNGAMGVLLKSNLPAISSLAYLLGLMRENRSMLRVNWTCGRNSSHSEDAGNFGFRHVSSFSSRFVTFRPFIERTFKQALSSHAPAPDIVNTAVRTK